MDLNTKQPVYQFGSQPPLLLSVGNDFERLPPEWNVCGAGTARLKKKLLTNAKLVHWTGESKGDDPSNWNKEIWDRYDKPECFARYATASNTESLIASYVELKKIAETLESCKAEKEALRKEREVLRKANEALEM